MGILHRQGSENRTKGGSGSLEIKEVGCNQKLDRVVKTLLSSKTALQPKKHVVSVSVVGVDHLFLMRLLRGHSGGPDAEGSGKITQGFLAIFLGIWLRQLRATSSATNCVGQLNKHKCTFQLVHNVNSVITVYLAIIEPENTTTAIMKMFYTTCCN